MGSTNVTVLATRTAAVRSLFVLAFALVATAASGDASAAKKDVSMCDGLKGAAKGWCTAAAALGCGVSTKHQAQCDALGDKFEALTGDIPPWEEPDDPPPPPPEEPLLRYEVDVLDLESGAVCDMSVNACDVDAEGNLVQNDLSVTPDLAVADGVNVLPVACNGPAIVRVLDLGATPFAGVDGTLVAAMLGDFQDVVDDISFAAGETIVFQNCDGNFFKLGVLEVGIEGATFEFEQIFLPF